MWRDYVRLVSENDGSQRFVWVYILFVGAYVVFAYESAGHE